MAQIQNIKEIEEIKKEMDLMKSEGLINEWELPYEYLLTKLTASIYFFTPKEQVFMDMIYKRLSKYPNFKFRENTEKELSQLKYRVEFN